ncbi:transcriptional regulator [Deinococcus sp.]|uniref:transcriptional regulator n=1 Tax=Deinococcus sp. TaxID=47478 RepID=UPI003CC5756D
MRRLLGRSLALLTLAGSAGAADVDTLISALKKSLGVEVRGAAVLELVFPPSKTPIRQARALPRLGAVPGLIRRNFSVTLAGQETLAGRTANRYLLTPTNAGAARWTIWIDSAWNLPLAYQEQMQDGTLARRAAFIRVNPAPTRLPAPLALTVSQPNLKKALLSILPGLKLPAGFEPLSVRFRRNAAGDSSSEVVLSDGLNVLALIAAKRPVRAAPGVAVRRLNASALWLVGTLPQSDLEAALEGIQTLDLGAISTLTGTFAPSNASEP